METIIPLHTFTGYPDGIKREFAEGVAAEVPADYAALLRDKGHIAEKPAKGKKSAPDAG